MPMNIEMLLEMAAQGSDERVVIGSRTDGLTAVDLLQAARRGAAHIAGTSAEHVGFVGLNSTTFPVALCAAALAGQPFAPLNYRLPDEQLRAVAGRLAPGLVVADDDMVERLADIDDLEVTPRSAFERLVAIDSSVPDGSFVDPESIAVMLFTSGTTGEPKAAVLRHRHLTSYILETVDFMGAHESDAQLVTVPPYHIAGIAAVLSALYAGRRIVYLPSFDPTTWISTMRSEAVTHAMVVPTMLGRIVGTLAQDADGLPTLRHLSYGGGRMPVELVERALEALPGVDFVNAYGLTETSSTIAILGPDDHREALVSADERVRRRLASVGRPLPSIELEIRDSDGTPCPAGVRGEIFVRGGQVAGEYVGRTALNADGWFPTNDAGMLDESGFLYLDGRLDDVIVRGAENLSPGEIEDVLMQHPEVLDAGVVGIPDPEWGETVVAAVAVPAGASVGEEELQEWVRHRLKSTKTPTHIDIRAELPHNETGKLLRRVLRDELREFARASREDGAR
jgi:fatty-acyl-CoA synthase